MKMKQVREVNENEAKFADTNKAVVTIRKKKVELEESVKREIEERELPRGVYKRSNGKWRVRVYNPKSKICSFLKGSFRSYEEAVIALNKKKAEFEKGGKEGYEGMKLPRGVRRSGHHRWRAQIWHPGLKKGVSLGCYNSPEEAERAYNEVKAEFDKRFMSKKSDSVGTSKGVNEKDRMVQFQERCRSKNNNTKGVGMSNKAECGFVGMHECLKHEVEFVHRFPGQVEGPSDILTSSEFNEAINGKQIGDEVLRCATEMTECGERNTSIVTKMTRTKECLCSYKTSSGCVDVANMKSAELDRRNKSRKRAKTACGRICSPNRLECGSDYGRTVNVRVKPSDQLVYDTPRSVMNLQKSESCMAATGVSNYGASAIHGKLQYEVVQGLSASVIKSGNPKHLRVSDGSGTSDVNHQKTVVDSYFDQALSMGFMNEYGQLVGEYSNLEESMWFGVC